MALRFGTAAITDLRLGGAAVDKLMMGDVQVWPVAVEPPPGGDPWTPADLPGLYSWHEAWDASTLVLNGNAVTQWSDKSGAGRHYVQSDADRQPSHTPGDKFIAVPNGAWRNMNMPTDSLNSQPAITIASLFSVADTSASNVWLRKGQFPYGRPGFYADDSYMVRNTTTLGGSGVPADYNGDSAICVFSWGAAGGVGRVNGIIPTSNGTVAEPFASQAQAAKRVILDWSGQIEPNNFAGQLYCLIEATEAASEDDRLRLEGYVAHGAGRLDLLPIDHPYKSAPPTKPTP